jgi:hypothetical protein
MNERGFCVTTSWGAPGVWLEGEGLPYFSVVRALLDRCRTVDEAVVPHVNRDSLRGRLSEPMPKGVCLHHYSHGLGTLWSMIFDVTDTRVEICFGAPSSPKNSWHTFGLQGPTGSTEYKAHLPDKPAAPGFWKRLSPGSSG